jgi:hypothetical protein
MIAFGVKFFEERKNLLLLCLVENPKGEMQEWLNWHAWKACEPLKGSAGSNPALSADYEAVGFMLTAFL